MYLMLPVLPYYFATGFGFSGRLELQYLNLDLCLPPFRSLFVLFHTEGRSLSRLFPFGIATHCAPSLACGEAPHAGDQASALPIQAFCPKLELSGPRSARTRSSPPCFFAEDTCLAALSCMPKCGRGFFMFS
jgi:hypothetical protein